MIDLEGPSNPPDKDGNRYIMTYICCLCYGVLLEPGSRLTMTEARRMFANCALRSGCMPTLLRSDRGPELKNALMQEYPLWWALVTASGRLGDRWSKDW